MTGGSLSELILIRCKITKLALSSEGRNFSLEPLAAYRVVKGYKNIIDADFNFGMQNRGIYLKGVYYSTKTLGLGFGLDKGTYALNFNYNLETGQ